MRLGSALCMEYQLGSAWQPRPARPPTESELMAMSRRYLSTDGPEINQTSFRQVPRRGASASRLGRNDIWSVSVGKHVVCSKSSPSLDPLCDSPDRFPGAARQPHRLHWPSRRAVSICLSVHRPCSYPRFCQESPN